MRKVEVMESCASGNVGGESGIDGIVEEGNVIEGREAAEDGRERAGDVCIGEVEGSDGVGDGIAGDSEPETGSLVTGIPGGEGIVGVGEGGFGLEEVEAFLVEGMGEEREGEGEKGEEKEEHFGLEGRRRRRWKCGGGRCLGGEYI